MLHLLCPTARAAGARRRQFHAWMESAFACGMCRADHCLCFTHSRARQLILSLIRGAAGQSCAPEQTAVAHISEQVIRALSGSISALCPSEYRMVSLFRHLSGLATATH